MAIIKVPKKYYYPMTPDRRARNGMVPQHWTPHFAGNTLNGALAHCRKTILFKNRFFKDSYSNSSGFTQSVWVAYFHSGYASTSAGSLKLNARCGVYTYETGAAKWRLKVYDGTTTTYSSWVTVPPGGGSSYDVSIEDIVDSEGSVDIDPDTRYEVAIEVPDGYRAPSSCIIQEVHRSYVDTNDTYVVDTRQAFNKGPIYDALHEDLCVAAHGLHKRNGAHLLSLTPDTISEAWTYSGLGYRNMLDTSLWTIVDSTTPGFNIQTQYHNPVHTDDVPCVFAVFASYSGGGTGGYVRLIGTSGALCTLNGWDTSGGWIYGTCNLDGSVDTQKLDLQISGSPDVSETLTVYGVSLFEYVT